MEEKVQEAVVGRMQVSGGHKWRQHCLTSQQITARA
jgi:hypothetical protein